MIKKSIWLPMSPEMSPYPILCSQIMAMVAINDLATVLRQPCQSILSYLHVELRLRLCYLKIIVNLGTSKTKSKKHFLLFRLSAVASLTSDKCVLDYKHTDSVYKDVGVAFHALFCHSTTSFYWVFYKTIAIYLTDWSSRPYKIGRK